MKREWIYPQPERAAIVLAGGEGSRLLSLTRKISGDDRPKQFCALLGEESLIEQTLRRVALGVEPRLTLVTVTRDHERFYGPVLASQPARNLVVQPRNRGTAPAILYSLLRLAEMAPQSQVAIFPSDHFIGDDQEFMRHIEMAFAAAALRPELTVLLGITPKWPETAYGWIEPGSKVAESHIFRVRRFWEKPATDVAAELLQRGCLWNSFVMVGKLSTLLGLFLIELPGLYVQFNKVRTVFDTTYERAIVERLYLSLRLIDFSKQILAASRPVNLAVLPVRDVEWSDLGEAARVMETIARTRLRPQWAAT